MKGRARRRSAAGILLALSLAACGSPVPEGTEDEAESIFRQTLTALAEALEVDDLLVVDGLPRMMVEQPGGGHRMGPFNPWGDPAFTAAIRAHPATEFCTRDEDGLCSRDRNPHLVHVSELLRTGARDAVVLASFVGLGSEPFSTRGFRIQFRFSDGGWNRTAVVEMDAAGVLDASF